MNKTNENFKIITDYIDKFNKQQTYGEWVVDENTIPFVSYSELVSDFIREFHSLIRNLNYNLKDYSNILEKNNLKLDYKIVKNANMENLNEETIIALITGVIKSEKLCNGVILVFLKDGTIVNWLKKLKELDIKNPS